VTWQALRQPDKSVVICNDIEGADANTPLHITCPRLLQDHWTSESPSASILVAGTSILPCLRLQVEARAVQKAGEVSAAQVAALAQVVGELQEEVSRVRRRGKRVCELFRQYHPAVWCLLFAMHPRECRVVLHTMSSEPAGKGLQLPWCLTDLCLPAFLPVSMRSYDTAKCERQPYCCLASHCWAWL
jgi:hypothetical protein